ncbi:hypothetical protein NIES2100_19690 [Calothrix sp. NIES-2100]|uniref:hypothetical protein n=1 Tax=Calothrix sp. NIES-2100 TaxID=1954172 RepID=UPI000B5F4E45|nr:hypothetical protein NIES2100_19690 [Calothrix sp. NIES-2100]
MNREKVISREYKILLKKDSFAGDEQQLLKAASDFWQAFTQVINNNNLVIKTDGSLSKIADTRIIKFYDTDQRLLHENDYILRERYKVDNDNDNKEVTLKFRHQDRYISQARNMRTGSPDKGKTKFEEDIKSPFTVLYSFSTTQEISPNENLSRMQDAARLYPGLPSKLIHYLEKEKIKVVGVPVRELLVKGARFQIRKDPELYSECALIIWYNDSGEQHKPAVVEFSFKYGDKNEDYSGKMAQRSYDLFQGLQKELTSWVDPNSMTKTAYIYSVSN